MRRTDRRGLPPEPEVPAFPPDPDTADISFPDLHFPEWNEHGVPARVRMKTLPPVEPPAPPPEAPKVHTPPPTPPRPPVAPIQPPVPPPAAPTPPRAAPIPPPEPQWLEPPAARPTPRPEAPRPEPVYTPKERVRAPSPPPMPPPPVAAPAPPPIKQPPPPVARKQVITVPPPAPFRSRWRTAARWSAGAIVILAVIGAIIGGLTFRHYSAELPSIESLQAYQPATVTTVHASDGRLLGEIYEERRYVLPLEEIPDHVRNAFIAAEDGNFWSHGGVDYFGILRAIARNAAKGRKAQGASTITQQVTRNFLLTRDKTIARKIKEVILAWRIESAYDKEHILYLYLNEIYLGSQAYGVEAASRTYFGKHVQDITIAEAAILAGLPQRPSDYSPHKHFEKAKARQAYVLGQMQAKELITATEAADAADEVVAIVARGNTFLEEAPHFTEYARRYLVEKYGEERVLNEGLRAVTTCDLDLQFEAQRAVTDGVFRVDQRMGLRREELEHLSTKDQINERVQAHEKTLLESQAIRDDPSGRQALSDTSTLEVDAFYPGVLTEVTRSWARVRIGAHEGIIPIAWSEWVYPPNPKRSWRRRTQNDLTAEVDTNDDGDPDAGILQRGDVVQVKVLGLDTTAEDLAKVFKNTPGAETKLVAAHLWQTPEVESALLSVDLEDGAVRAMVGGADFTRSQFNRAVQAKRQVGSTFKPIVYAAALASKRLTTASIIADAPLAFETSQPGFIWKPSNYGNDFMGNITLRKALALSRNTVTVRVLDSIDSGMNDDIVYGFARKLGIGGPPLHALGEGWKATPDTDHLCPWVRETSRSTICMDRYPPKDPNLDDRAHRAQLTPDDKHLCRACDLSMGLGSASLTMEELVRAYSAFPTGGKLTQPYFITEVTDRNGKVLERHRPEPAVEVMEPEVATIATWLLRGVVDGGTAAAAKKALPLDGLAGKTGTTNDEKDAWFVGFTNDIITAVWVGYDQPRSLGVSSTGGRTALPIWLDYMKVATKNRTDAKFPIRGDVRWAGIDERTGRRVSRGGRNYPFLPGTVPESSGTTAGQLTLEDLTTEL